MSQKPNSGGQARSVTPARVAPKEVVIQGAPAKVTPTPTKIEAEAAQAEAAQAEATQADATQADATVESVANVVPPVTSEPIATPVVTEVAPVMAAASTPEPARETIAAAADLAADSAQVMSQSITTTADTVAAVTAEVVEAASASEPTRPHLTPNLTQGMKTMMKSTEDFVAFGQANLEAFVKSGQIWSAGVQELTKQIASSAKASFDESVSTFKAMSTVKSVKEAMELQSTFAKAALEKAMVESNKLTDASIKLTEQALAPITARVTVAVETFGKAA
jgi:phasin family protein